MRIFMVKGIPQHLQGMHLKTCARKNDVCLCACDVAQGTRKFREALCTNLPLYFTADPKSHIFHSSFLKLELQMKLIQWLWEIFIHGRTILSIWTYSERTEEEKTVIYKSSNLSCFSKSSAFKEYIPGTLSTTKLLEDASTQRGEMRQSNSLMTHGYIAPEESKYFMKHKMSNELCGT